MCVEKSVKGKFEGDVHANAGNYIVQATNSSQRTYLIVQGTHVYLKAVRGISTLGTSVLGTSVLGARINENAQRNTIVQRISLQGTGCGELCTGNNCWQIKSVHGTSLWKNQLAANR